MYFYVLLMTFLWDACLRIASMAFVDFFLDGKMGVRYGKALRGHVGCGLGHLVWMGRSEGDFFF